MTKFAVWKIVNLLDYMDLSCHTIHSSYVHATMFES